MESQIFWIVAYLLSVAIPVFVGVCAFGVFKVVQWSWHRVTAKVPNR